MGANQPAVGSPQNGHARRKSGKSAIKFAGIIAAASIAAFAWFGLGGGTSSQFPPQPLAANDTAQVVVAKHAGFGDVKVTESDSVPAKEVPAQILNQAQQSLNLKASAKESKAAKPDKKLDSKRWVRIMAFDTAANDGDILEVQDLDSNLTLRVPINNAGVWLYLPVTPGKPSKFRVTAIESASGPCTMGLATDAGVFYSRNLQRGETEFFTISGI